MKAIIDVVIPTYHPDERLLQILDSMAAQTVPPRRVHIVNTEKSGMDALLDAHGLTWETLDLTYPFLSVTNIRKEEFDHGATRNMGFRMCGGADFVLTMTQDALPADDRLVERLLEGLEAPERACADGGLEAPETDDSAPETEQGAFSGPVAVSYARQLPNADAPVEERLSRGFNYPEISRIKSETDRGELGIKTYYCSNVCAMYRMDVWQVLGGFPDRAIFNEDMIYASKALKAGYRICYAAKAQVYHSHDYNASQQFHRNFDLGVSQAMNPQVFGALSSEGEGVSYVKAVIRQLLNEHGAAKVPGFCMRCAARLAGFRLGKMYGRLPRTLVVKCSSNKSFWRQ